MPDDYMNTVSQLERHLTGDHIGSILECKDAVTANQRILDCLIVQQDNKEDIFDLCDKLSVITDAPLLTAAIEDLIGIIYVLCMCVCMFVCVFVYTCVCMYICMCTVCMYVCIYV